MSENETPHSEDSTEQQELESLLSENAKALKALVNPLAKAIRGKLQGKPVDFSTARHEVMQALDDVIDQVSPATRASGPQSYSPADLIAGYWDRLAARRDGATTGIGGLDRVLSGGFEQDRLAVLLGAPGSGKTTLVNQIAVHAAANKRPVLYVTSEDLPHVLLAKTVASLGKIDYSTVLRGRPAGELSREQRDEARRQITEKMQAYGASVGAQYLRYVDATQGITLDQIYDQAQAHFHALESEARGAPILVVDYLQRLSRFENLGVDARQSATVYTERLRAMACDLHCTTIVLSAMNRASGYHAGNSTIAAAKESGDIDYTADIILAIGAQDEAPEPEPGVRRWMLRIDKNRQGSTTYDEHHIYLDWCAARQQFTEADEATIFVGSSGSSNGTGRNRRGR